MTLLPSKVWLSKTTQFRCFQIVHVSATHQHLHLLALTPTADQFSCATLHSVWFLNTVVCCWWFNYSKPFHQEDKWLLLLVSSRALHPPYLDIRILLHRSPCFWNSSHFHFASSAVLKARKSFASSTRWRSLLLIRTWVGRIFRYFYFVIWFCLINSQKIHYCNNKLYLMLSGGIWYPRGFWQ